MFDFLKNKLRKELSPMGERREGPALVLALDIGTEIIKALVFEVQGDKGVVRGYGRARQTLGDMQGGAVTNIHGVIEHCRDAIKDSVQMAKAMPDQMIMGIGGELVKGATTVVNYERPDPQSQISLTELKNIVHKIQWKAFDQVRSQLAWETGYSEIDVKLVNAAIVDVRIDGYRVANPLGFQGKNMSVAIFNAFAPLVHFGALQTIAQELEIDLLAIAAEPYAVSRCISTEDAHDHSAIFIDIGGGTTDIAVVRNGGVEGTKMFALGGRSFTRRLSQILDCSFEDAEKTKIKYSAGKLDDDTEAQVAEAVKSDAGVWLSGVELTLSEFYNVDVMPHHIYLCGGGSALPEIKDALESKQWVKRLSFAEPPIPTFIQPADVTNIQDPTGTLTNPQDVTVMALANLALDLAGDEPMVSKVLRKVVRMMQA